MFEEMCNFTIFGHNKSEEAALYYLYMIADGEVSYSEEKIFNIICNELKIDDDEKNSVIQKCKELVDGLYGTATIFSLIVREKIEDQAGKGLDASGLVRIIWNLVNLGFADSNYSEEEKQIVQHVRARWSIAPEIYQELVDIADTMLALTKQKEWIVSTFPKGSARDKREKNIDTEIMQLLDDVKLTIKEVTM